MGRERLHLLGVINEMFTGVLSTSLMEVTFTFRPCKILR